MTKDAAELALLRRLWAGPSGLVALGREFARAGLPDDSHAAVKRLDEAGLSVQVGYTDRWQLTQRGHDALVAAGVTAPTIDFERPIDWRPVPKGEQWNGEDYFRLEAEVDGARWRVAANDFPVEPSYTLFIGDDAIGSFDNWPAAWSRPGDESAKPAGPGRAWLPIVIAAESIGVSATFEFRDEPRPHVRVETPSFGARARGWLPLLSAMRAGQAVTCPECKHEPVTVVLVPVPGRLGDLRFSCSSCGAGGDVRGGPA